MSIYIYCANIHSLIKIWDEIKNLFKNKLKMLQIKITWRPIVSLFILPTSSVSLARWNPKKLILKNTKKNADFYFTIFSGIRWESTSSYFGQYLVYILCNKLFITVKFYSLIEFRIKSWFELILFFTTTPHCNGKLSSVFCPDGKYATLRERDSW